MCVDAGHGGMHQVWIEVMAIGGRFANVSLSLLLLFCLCCSGSIGMGQTGSERGLWMALSRAHEEGLPVSLQLCWGLSASDISARMFAKAL